MKFEEIQLPSNRKFGLFFAAVFAACAVYVQIKSSMHLLILVFATLSLISLVIAIVRPDYLLPFNRLWMRLGFLIGKIVSPIIIGVIFFALITPIAVVMRFMGRDELRLKREYRESHWKQRSPTGPEPSSFKYQF